jgi:hypothetical protein
MKHKDWIASGREEPELYEMFKDEEYKQYYLNNTERGRIGEVGYKVHME